MPNPSSHLIMFTGTECAKCHKLEPLLDKLAEEKGQTIEKLEVWHNAENADYMQKVGQGRCMSLPMLYNSKSDAIICGYNDDEEKLKEWMGV